MPRVPGLNLQLDRAIERRISEGMSPYPVGS
jgi:hypothetical protein